MMTHRRLFLGIAAIGSLTLALGCGDGGPKLASSGGVVNFKGAAMEGATVTFLYDDGQMASGISGADGKFTLTTSGRAGAPLGLAKVTVTKTTGGFEGGSAAAPTPDDMVKMYSQKGMAMKDSAVAKDVLPAKYANADSSGLTAEVKSSGNDFVFNLEE